MTTDFLPLHRPDVRHQPGRRGRRAGRFRPARIRTLEAAFTPFPAELRAELMALQAPGDNELEREALAANGLARCYAACVDAAGQGAGAGARRGRARPDHPPPPELGFTRQTNNPALLAELTGIDVIADFRSRDVAAGGQGAPLVPAFHAAAFGKPGTTRVVVNIGGIGNISVLHGDGRVSGFDTGPGNVLMDLLDRAPSRARNTTKTAPGPRAAGRRRLAGQLAGRTLFPPAAAQEHRARPVPWNGSTRGWRVVRSWPRPTCRRR
jgi:1,6-anhydro-N-acetylmuramate kinase